MTSWSNRVIGAILRLVTVLLLVLSSVVVVEVVRHDGHQAAALAALTTFGTNALSFLAGLLAQDLRKPAS
jgi:hypothetical protein